MKTAATKELSAQLPHELAAESKNTATSTNSNSVPEFSISQDKNLTSLLGKRKKIFQVETVKNDSLTEKEANYDEGLLEDGEYQKDAGQIQKTVSDVLD